MQTGTLLNRIRRAEQAAKAQSKYSPECICFPDGRTAVLRTPFEHGNCGQSEMSHCTVIGSSHSFSSTYPSGFATSSGNTSGAITLSSIVRRGLPASHPIYGRR